MNQKEIVLNVVEQITNMLTNNFIEENGSECFQSWCADGEVFELMNGIPKSETAKHIEVVNSLASFVDALSEAIEKELEK